MRGALVLFFVVGCGASSTSAPAASVRGPEATTTEHEVAATEVVLDGDGDRIVDADDACPAEAELYNGERDEDGCPDCGSIVLTAAWEPPPIVFVEGTTTLTNDRPLDFMAGVIAAHVDYASVTLVGSMITGEPHTDGLGIARAEVVRAALVARGIAIERLVAVAGTRDAAEVRFEVRREGPPHPLCNTPFPGCDAEHVSAAMPEPPVFFARRSVALDPAAEEAVARLVATMTRHPLLGPIEVEGRAARDERGGAELSLRRAEAVVAAMVAHGIAAERLVAIGGGRGDDERTVRFFSFDPGCRGLAAPRPSSLDDGSAEP